MSDQMVAKMSGAHMREPSADAMGPLPPRPDPLTGEPAPPTAPGYHGPDVLAEYNPTADRRFRRLPQPPPGMGTVLSWYRLNNRGRLARFGFALLLLVAGAAGMSLARGDGLALLAAWPVWPVILVVAGLMAGRARTVSVGADWVQRDGACVRLYELTSVAAGYDPTWLRLTDPHGSLVFSLDELQRERAAWDLVYNGIRHSAARGAEVEPAAAQLLQLSPAGARQGK